MDTDILIIGGGLAGLGLAVQLHDQGRDFVLVDARARLGGRIKTEQLGDAQFDMGPAWFWPGQPRVAKLVDRFGLQQFEQFCDGMMTFEDAHGQPQRAHGYASMQGSLRLRGGFGALIDALDKALPEARKRRSAPVIRLEHDAGLIRATLQDASVITCRHVVIAMPPRVAIAGIEFVPALPPSTAQAMDGIATWMAGQAKAVAVYDHPFWRQNGQSGDAMSRRGPLVEIHDASPDEGSRYALFGFIGVPPNARRDQDGLRHAITAQLERLFGPEARNPQQLFLKDWSCDPLTATALDQAPLHAHPQYGLPAQMVGHWDGALHFGGTEVAPKFGGYLEGALEAAETVLAALDS